MTKHDAMTAYFEPKVQELVGRMMDFNFSGESPDRVSFLTNYSDKVRKNYIRIGAEKEYGFTILITKFYSQDSDDLNLQAMNFAQAFMDWLDAQGEKKVFPDLGEKCQVKKMEVLQNMPNLSGIDMENGVAQYMIQCRVIYFERK